MRDINTQPRYPRLHPSPSSFHTVTTITNGPPLAAPRSRSCECFPLCYADKDLKNSPRPLLVGLFILCVWAWLEKVPLTADRWPCSAAMFTSVSASASRLLVKHVDSWAERHTDAVTQIEHLRPECRVHGRTSPIRTGKSKVQANSSFTSECSNAPKGALVVFSFGLFWFRPFKACYAAVFLQGAPYRPDVDVSLSWWCCCSTPLEGEEEVCQLATDGKLVIWLRLKTWCLASELASSLNDYPH